jgi:hypothetical protein
VLLFDSIRLGFLGQDVRFNRLAIGVVIGQGGMNLRQGQMPNPVGYLLLSQQP